LLDRTKKLGDELGKSSLSPEDKAELWEFLWSFYSGIHKDLEKQYPLLKKEHCLRQARALVSAILGTLIKNTERGPKKVKSISRTNTSTK